MLGEVLGRRIDVVQKTPGRVAHRRAKLDRERWVEFLELSIDESAPRRLSVLMRTQHGTYVKEAISSDDGNTTPSLASLLEVPCECLELDVMAILDQEGEPVEVRSSPPVFGAGVGS